MRFSRFSRLSGLMAEQAAPRRTDPIAAALAFAIREAVRLEVERERLAVAPTRAKVVVMKPTSEPKVA